jgi:predicted MFS family arabinose efflux permease
VVNSSVVRGGLRFDNPARLIYVNALFIIGTLGTLITPALLDVWGKLNWSTTRLGVVAGLELAGVAIGSLSGLYWQRRWNWRRVALVSLAIAVGANIACLVTADFAGVCLARSLVGISGGLLTAIYSAVLANARSPSRVIAATTFVQIGVEAAFLYSSASLFDRLGSSGLFILMSVLFASLLPLVKLLPFGWPAQTRASPTDNARSRGSLRAYPLLASFVPFIIVQTGVYTFLGEFGRAAAHLSDVETLHAIGISVLLSSLGSIAAFLLDIRIGLRAPISVAIVLMTGSLSGMVLGSRSASAFLCYISLLQIGWIFLNCYLYTALIDANNLLVPAATPVSTFGSAFGASMMGFVLEQHGLMGALTLCAAAMTLTALLTLPFLRRRDAKGDVGTRGDALAH